MVEDAFKRFTDQLNAIGSNNTGGTIFDALLGKNGNPKGLLERNTQGLLGAKLDPFGIFRETKFGKIWSEGFPVSTAQNIAPPDGRSWVDSVAASNDVRDQISRN